jgi:carbon-monoxide dehydrogenase medium subunit
VKPAPFALDQPASLAEARALAGAAEARIIAGGQSLGPMLNLRLARPARLVAVGRLPELAGAEATATALTIGAGVTHAAIADGRVPSFHDGLLARVAAGIAYRAVRNRGTIGGSLCHADPAADWVCALTALDAAVLIAGPDGDRVMALRGFVTGAFRVALRPGEIVRAVRVPRPSPAAGWGYVKACRKPGEFAHAMAAVLRDGGTRRAVIGALGGPPLVLGGDAIGRADAMLAERGLDPVARHMQGVTLRRALEQAGG